MYNKYRKMLAIVLTTAILASLAPWFGGTGEVRAAGANLIANGDFTQGMGGLGGWTIGSGFSPM